MPKPPSVDEREFLRLTGNHGAYCDKLRILGLASASQQIAENAHHVGLCWLRLAHEHLTDSKCALDAGRTRSVYSRAYYAAYNTSKAVRYIVSGSVSLNSDDHKKASDLPDDLAGVDKWSEAITTLYEHRLRADYDNWTSTAKEASLSPADAFDLAAKFYTAALTYLEAKYGIKL